jgi:hypothetical protein
MLARLGGYCAGTSRNYRLPDLICHVDAKMFIRGSYLRVIIRAGGRNAGI